MTTVVDATVIVAALVDSGHDGLWAESAIAEGGLASPELALVESTNVLRRLAQSGHLSSVEAAIAFRTLLRLNLELFPFMPFAERIWELRENLTSYDAWYVALAEGARMPARDPRQKTRPRCRTRLRDHHSTPFLGRKHTRVHESLSKVRSRITSRLPWLR